MVTVTIPTAAYRQDPAPLAQHLFQPHNTVWLHAHHGKLPVPAHHFNFSDTRMQAYKEVITLGHKIHKDILNPHVCFHMCTYMKFNESICTLVSSQIYITNML